MPLFNKICLLVFVSFSVNAIAASNNIADSTFNKSTKELKKRIKKGEDVNFQDEDGLTALLNASYYGFLESVKILLDAGADVSIKGNDGTSAVIMLAYRKRKSSDDDKILDLLISKGSDIDSQDNDGSTALSFAVASDDKNLVKILLSRGASVDVKDNDGQTAIWNICQSNKHGIEILDMLLLKGADINALDNDGDNLSALYQCDGKDELMNHMISKGLK